MIKNVIVNEHSSQEICGCDLTKLHNYLKCKKLTSALKVTPCGIEAKSWIGVVKYKNTNIQILPKLIYTSEYDEKSDNGHARACILRNLIYMLSYTQKLEIKTNSESKLFSSKNPFLEVLIREYAKSLFDCLKRLTPKNYIREENNLNYLKGKLKFSENIRYNCANEAKFYCEYDDYSENNPLNQLFLYVSTCLYNISEDSNNRKILRFIINYYSAIELVRFDKFKTNNIKLSRNQELFKKPFNLAKMFVEHSSVDLSKNKFENITMLWDMNKLFEEFIFGIMKKFAPDLKCTVLAQKGHRLLKDDTGKKRNTYVDILIKKGKEKVVLDTKYKKFTNINDFSNADVFQVSTYCLLHNAHRAILLYPQWNDNKIEDKIFYLNTDDTEGQEPYSILFATINLRYDYIGDNLALIKDEIERVLNVIKLNILAKIS